MPSAPPPKRQFLSIRGAEISCAARDFPPKRQFLSIRGAEFSCAARDSPTKRKIFKNRGGDEENVFKKQSQLFNFPQFLRFFSISFTIEFVELLSCLDVCMTFVTMDIRRESDSIEPIWKIGSSDFFFALGKVRSDLLVELNDAMSRIQDENKYYNQQLNDKYLSSTETNRFLTDKEKEWLADHGTVRVGYQDNYLAFCAEDKATGALTGALKDYLDYASTALENAQIDFEAVSYPTAAAAIEALKNGEVDCMFPANLTEYESEMLDVVISGSRKTIRRFLSTDASGIDMRDVNIHICQRVGWNSGRTSFRKMLKGTEWSVKNLRPKILRY